MKKIYMIFLALAVSLALKAQQDKSLVGLKDTTVVQNASNLNKVSSDKLIQSSQINLGDALYGLLPGLYVMQGKSGVNLYENAPSFNLRGKSTFNDANPLVLVDGFERSLDDISLVEVASVEVLSDAVSAAIYGVRGANGVIKITTKHGQSGSNVSLNYSYGMATPTRKPVFADAPTYAKALNEALVNDGLSARYSEEEIGYFASGQYPDLYPNVDWQNEMYKDFGNVHQFDVQFDGGNNRFKYYSAITYSNQQAMFKPVEYTPTYKSQPNKLHLNVRTNLDVVISSTTDLHINLLGRIDENKRPGTSLPNILDMIYNTPSAAFPVKTQEGDWAGTNIFTVNPVAEIADNGYSNVIGRTMLADMRLTQDLSIITKGLYGEMGISYDNFANYLDQANKSYNYAMPTGTIDNPTYAYYGKQSELTYKSEMNKQHMYNSVSGKIGYDRSNGKSDLKSYLMYEQIVDMSDGRNRTFKRQSILALASYSYDSRFFVDAVVNYAGSSVMPDDNYFDTYPAISGAWIASNESFMEDLPFNFFKVRASFGMSGSDRMGHDLDKQYFVEGNTNNQEFYQFLNSNKTYNWTKEGALGVVDLKMEKARKFDFGIDLTVFNNLNFSATYFNENRSNILVGAGNVVSSVIGIGVPQLCNGEVANSGIETALSWNKKFNDFNVAVSGNFTYAKNEIIENNEGFQPYPYLYKKGNSLDQEYGLESVGFFMDQAEIDAAPLHTFYPVKVGDIRYKDQNNDNKIDEDDQVLIGKSDLPEIYYGCNIALNYKNFGVDLLFQGVGNRTIYLQTSSLFRPFKNNSNISSWYLDENTRWTPGTAETANLPRLSTTSNDNNYRKSDVWLENGGFIKLRNVNIHYNIPVKNSKIKNAQVYVRGTNLFTSDHLKYADPEMFTINYPTMSTYTLGLNISF